MIVDRILQLIELKGINKSQFYKSTGLSNGFLDKVKDIGASKIEQILKTYPDINPIWFVMGTGEPISEKYAASSKHSTSSGIILRDDKLTYEKRDLGLPKVVAMRDQDTEAISLVPVKAAAGYLNGYADPEYIENLPVLNIPNLGQGSHRAFEVRGHSMNPTLHNSCIGIGRWLESLDDIRDRRIYTVVTKSEGVVTKRLLNRIDDSGRLILISDNQNKREYPNILLDPSDVLEIWYLRAVLSFEFPEPDIINNRVNDLEAKYTILENRINRLGI